MVVQFLYRAHVKYTRPQENGKEITLAGFRESVISIDLSSLKVSLIKAADDIMSSVTYVSPMDSNWLWGLMIDKYIDLTEELAEKISEATDMVVAGKPFENGAYHLFGDALLIGNDMYDVDITLCHLSL